ncbi:hypothetical protein [Natrinema longum]|uniref:Uncharacterized protein n=1 Tax=Natrinema longum TaxID=370324 RepID=A0A8A2U7S6_9EURY|nr:hypothetical protein [Natrinema longum]MBZ6493903.1 hypothetical protein [Natrinema longum]QSW84760.1 hypothetical protein J0X27_15100 [Natrinema longum]
MPGTTSKPDRYAEHQTKEGTVRIFDRRNDAAWIESDTTLSIAWQT